MKTQKIFNKKISEERQESDDVDLSSKESNSGIPTWLDILPFFNFAPYFILFYYCWYFMNHNVMILLMFIYLLVPIVDILLPMDKYNLKNKEAKHFEKDQRFLIPLYTFWILDFFSYFWAIYVFSFGEFIGIIDQITLLLVVSHMGGAGLTIGHELLHRKQTINKI